MWLRKSNIRHEHNHKINPVDHSDSIEPANPERKPANSEANRTTPNPDDGSKAVFVCGKTSYIIRQDYIWLMEDRKAPEHLCKASLVYHPKFQFFFSKYLANLHAILELDHRPIMTNRLTKIPKGKPIVFQVACIGLADPMWLIHLPAPETKTNSGRPQILY